MRIAALALAIFTAAPLSAAELRGHGGPVRALAIIPDGGGLVSGGFDSNIIVWSLANAAADRVLQFHDGSANALAALPDRSFASAGADGRIAIWREGADKPDRLFEGHSAPVVALSASARHLASASWDGTARVWPLNGGAARVLVGHQGNVNGVAFVPGAVVTVGYDATVRFWPETGDTRVIKLPTPLNALAAFADGRVIVGGADGRLRLMDESGAIRELEVSETPIIALAISPDETHISAAGIRGDVAIVDARAFSLERLLAGPTSPVWSLAFSVDSREIFTGGNDHIIRRWNATTGEISGAVTASATKDPLAAYAGDRGAEVFRACIACHTLRPGEGVRAGPSLHGIMGRRIGTLPGYRYSSGFGARDIVWTKETVSRLFEIGPHAFTPGTSMPEQTIIRAEDRAALAEFLEAATK